MIALAAWGVVAGVGGSVNEGNARSGHPWPDRPDARLTASAIPWLRPARDSPHPRSPPAPLAPTSRRDSEWRGKHLKCSGQRHTDHSQIIRRGDAVSDVREVIILGSGPAG